MVCQNWPSIRMTYYQYLAAFTLTVRNTKQRLSNRLIPTMSRWREFWVIDDSATKLYQMQKISSKAIQLSK